MKKALLILFLTLFETSFAQKFTTDPEFPTQTSAVTITFNIKEMSNTSLVGYTGTLYTHTGVNTNLGDWQHVIESWGNNNTQPSLTRISEDVYSIFIENPRDFYNITNPGENISSLNFVLRSADAGSPL